MTIYRDGKAIALTEQELSDTYTEVRIRNYKDEVALKLAEDYNIDPSTANIDVEAIALDVICEIGENDTIVDLEQECFNIVIKKHLKRIGGIK
jgi:hypothetical protein